MVSGDSSFVAALRALAPEHYPPPGSSNTEVYPSLDALAELAAAHREEYPTLTAFFAHLFASPIALQAALGLLSPHQLHRVAHELAAAALPRPLAPCTEALAVDYDNGGEHVSLGCPALDQVLGGGLRRRQVTEFVGESATGKTQLCLQVCLHALLRSPTNLAVYLCTETFAHRRLLDLLATLLGGENVTQTQEAVLQRLYIRSVSSCQDLVLALASVQPWLRQFPHNTVQVLVVDSVAAAFRCEFGLGAEDAAERSALLFHVAAALKHAASECGGAVLVTNQVTSKLEGVAAAVPALGLSWSQCVNTRVFLAREDRSYDPHHHQLLLDSSSQLPGVRRWLTVVFSPYLPAGRGCAYAIEDSGFTACLHDTHTHFTFPLEAVFRFALSIHK